MIYEDLIMQNRKKNAKVKIRCLDALHSNDAEDINTYKAQPDAYDKECLEPVKLEWITCVYVCVFFDRPC